jgi:hypothetical protein
MSPAPVLLMLLVVLFLLTATAEMAEHVTGTPLAARSGR